MVLELAQVVSHTDQIVSVSNYRGEIQNKEIQFSSNNLIIIKTDENQKKLIVKSPNNNNLKITQNLY